MAITLIALFNQEQCVLVYPTLFILYSVYKQLQVILLVRGRPLHLMGKWKLFYYSCFSYVTCMIPNNWVKYIHTPPSLKILTSPLKYLLRNVWSPHISYRPHLSCINNERSLMNKFQFVILFFWLNINITKYICMQNVNHISNAAGINERTVITIINVALILYTI